MESESFALEFGSSEMGATVPAPVVPCRTRTYAALAVCEEPANRIGSHGVGALSDSELLAMLLQGSGFGPAATVDVGRRLMAEAGTLSRLAQWPIERLEGFQGIGAIKACQLVASIEIARRVMAGSEAAPLLNAPQLTASFMQSRVLGLEVEKFWVLCLNRKSRLIRCVEATSGTATAALAHPREVFRPALLASASAVICVHNHPSGDPAPSAADLQVTRQLREAAKAVDVELLDHVIIGRPGSDPMGRGYFSFREAGML